MPRDSNGNYSKPSGTTAVSGNIIDPTSWNNLTTDLGTEITNSMPRDGSAAMTGVAKLSDGFAGSPGLAFGSDLGVGMYRKTTQTASLVSGTVEAFTWSPTTITMNGAVTLTGGVTQAGNLALNGNITIAGGQTFTATTTNTTTGLSAITGASKALGPFVGSNISGTGIPANTTITAITYNADNTVATITMSQAATATGSITVTASGNMTVAADPIAALGVATKQYVDNLVTPVSNRVIGKNRVTNGDMRVAQDGTSFATPASGSYTLDQWAVTWSGAAPASVAQVTGPTGFKNALRITGATGNTQAGVFQRFPSVDVADLVGGNIAIQANLSASVGQTVSWQLRYANAVDDFTSRTLITSGTWSVTTTATKFTTFVTGMVSSAANGLELAIFANNGGAFTSGTLDITGVQLESGSVPTAFEFIQYSEQLRRCQFFYSIFPYIIIGTSGSDTQTPLPVTMRTTPIFSGGGAGFNTANSSAGFMVASQTTRIAQTIKCSARL